MSTSEEGQGRQWIAGNRAAWRRILGMAAGELDGDERKLAAALAELEDVRRILRRLCKDFGDNNWDDDLHLGDALDKHLGNYLRERADNGDDERQRTREAE